MKDWKEYKLEDVCKRIASGGTPLTSKKEYYENGTIPWLKTTEVNKEIIWAIDTFITEEGLKNSSAKLIPANSIIVAMYGDGGTAGKAALTKIPLTTNQACCNLTIDEEKADYGFIFYFLKINYENLVNLKSGGSQQNLNAFTIRKFPILLPPLPTQHRIASILSTYDELIEVNNQRIKILEETARELYKEWFVRMRFPATAGRPGYKQAKFVKGMPEGWEVKKLEEATDITSSKRIFLSDYVIEGVPFYRGKEISIKSRNESLSDILYISRSKFAEIKRKFGAPKTGDILITAVGTIGNIYIVKDSDGEFYFKDGNLIWIRNSDNHSVSMYLYFYFISDAFINSLSSITIGSSQEALTIASVKKINILIPSKELISKFYFNSKPIRDQIDVLQQQNTQLSQIRDRLLPRLISGKLEVKTDKILLNSETETKYN